MSFTPTLNFETATKNAGDLEKSGRLSNNDRLTLYKYYKQATVGDCNIVRPGIFNPKGQAKFDAWNSVSGLSSEQAKNEYVAFVLSFLN